MSKIEWTGKTWNCITGCTKISSGCLHCYSERMTKRLQGMYFAQLEKGSTPGMAKYKDGFNKVATHHDALYLPRAHTKPTTFFVNSMSDTFHMDVSSQFIHDIFAEMRIISQHTYQLLTKRSERLLQLSCDLEWCDNIWMGVTVESSKYSYRIDHLRQTEAKVKFLSLEPLLDELPSLNLDEIDWCIVGAETGPGARYMNPDWAREIRDQCRDQDVKFFMKKVSGKEPVPDDLMIREFPEVVT